jgi:hypothetical protein
MARRQNQKLVEVDDLGPQTEGYRRLGTAVDDIRARLSPDELLHIRYESFLHSPGPSLVELCNLLGVDAPPDFVEACASLAGSASRARDRVQWSDAERHAVEELIAARPVLAGYDFEHEGKDATPGRVRSHRTVSASRVCGLTDVRVEG